MPINKTDIKLKQSQRLDDTDYGGGQATSIDVISGEINNLYPDISRLDRTYGRVSMRKAFLQVDTPDRSVYYGAHAAITKNAKDPNVTVCFFTDEDWFSQRKSARTRIESYLTQGPQYMAALWGNHYRGTSVLQLHTAVVVDAPKNGEVLVLVSGQGTTGERKQYVRIQKVVEEIKKFASSDANTYAKKILTLTLGGELQYDFQGTEITQGIGVYSTKLATCIYTTVVADASKYYGIAELEEDVEFGSAQIKVNSIYNRLLPSTQSSTAITDAGIASTVASVLDVEANDGVQDPDEFIEKPTSYRIESNGILYLGTGVKRGSFSWEVSPKIQDDGGGNIIRNNEVIGSIDYTAGIITFISAVQTSIVNGVIKYKPAVVFNQVTISGAIPIEVGNRGYVYTYLCDPIPMKGTLRVDYLADGKWYTLKDTGQGALVGADRAVGAGQVNLKSGSVSMTLGAQPDVGSSIMLFWAQASRQYSFPTQNCRLNYQFTTKHEGVARQTFCVSWNDNTQGIVDNGRTELVEAVLEGGTWVAKPNGASVGRIAYATGEVQFSPSDSQEPPKPSERLLVSYDYGEAKVEDITVTNRLPNGMIQLQLKNTPIIPNTVKVKWKTDLENYGYKRVVSGTAAKSVSVKIQTPVHEYYDEPHTNDDKGGFRGEKEDGSLIADDSHFGYSSVDDEYLENDEVDFSTIPIPEERLAVIDYEEGTITFMPDRRATYPVAMYKWRDTGDRQRVERQQSYMNGFGQTVNYTVGENKPILEYSFSGIKYRLAVCLFPPGRNVIVSYRTSDGSSHDSYYLDAPNTYYISPSSKMQIIPGSVTLKVGNIHLVDVGTGELFYDTNPNTGTGTKCGLINYEDRTVTIIEDYAGTDKNIKLNVRDIKVITASGSLNIEPVSYLTFRAPGSPITPGSLQLRATMGNGTQLTATADTRGNITGQGVQGRIDFITGVCSVHFGEWVEDEYGSMAEEDRPDWYASTYRSGTQIWQPYAVQASTVVLNCTITEHLSLDSKLLGLDPTRLPIDGRVPIFRNGYIILIHCSKEKVVDVNNGGIYNLEGGNLAEVAVYDKNGKYFPEITSGQFCTDEFANWRNYTVDLKLGQFQFSNFVDLNDYDEEPTRNAQGELVYKQYKTPFRVKYRFEDMCLATDVQITGHLGLNQPLTHSYKAGETMVSSVLPSGDLQSAAYNEFVQDSWNNVWSDDLRGYDPLASYNFVDFPIQVTNEGAIKERWLIRFTSSSTFDVVGENLGVLLKGLPVVPQGETQGGRGGWVSDGGGNYTLVVKNKLTGNTYWTMDSRGFSEGWQSGNCIRFNTDGANMPYWFVRTVLQATPQEATDDYQFLIRGDAM